MLVSIIVPVYNVEKYIENCIESLINQTYSNIEIIIIDDGSNDSSLERVKKYSDKRIFIYTQRNKGLGAARNTGMNKSKGEYICFVDSDDYVTNTFIEDFVNNSNNKDIVICNFEIKFQNQKKIKSQLKKLADNMITETSNNKIGPKLVLNYRYIAWNKMYSQKILKGFKWGSGAHEDINSLVLLTKNPNIIYVNKKNYIYNKKLNTLSTSTNENKIKDINNNYKYVYKNNKNRDLVDSIKLRQYCSLLINYVDLYNDDKLVLKKKLELINKEFKSILYKDNINNLSIARKKFVMYALNLKINKILLLSKFTSK